MQELNWHPPHARENDVRRKTHGKKRYIFKQDLGWKLTSNCTKAPGNPFFLSCLILTWQAPNRVKTDLRSSASVSVETLVDRLQYPLAGSPEQVSEGRITNFPTKIQASGGNKPCAFLAEGSSCRRSPRGHFGSVLGTTTWMVILSYISELGRECSSGYSYFCMTITASAVK